MTRRKGTKPEQFAGPFQDYDQIPTRYQLGTYSSIYRGKEIWEDYKENVLFEEHDSEYIRKTARIAGNSWLDHFEQRSKHHALATPTDVEMWCQKLRNGNRARRTCYEHYFIRIYNFYKYLKQSRRHPHLYNPLLLAAIEFDTTREIWMYRVNSRPEVVSRE